MKEASLPPPGMPDPCPGYSYYLGMTRPYGDAQGGITIVAPNGKYLYLPFMFSLEMLESPEAAEHLLDHAAKDISKHLEKLK